MAEAMTVCRARWEPPRPWQKAGESPESADARWRRNRVWLCAGSKYNPDPCEAHGCGYVNGDGNAVFVGTCRCPEPEERTQSP